MNSQREIYQALLDGKTLINKREGLSVKLEGNSQIICTFGYPEDWSIYDETWKMKPADWYVLNTSEIMKSPIKYISTSQKFGMMYHTEEHAKRARDEMRKANLLRYWASVIGPEWKANWKNKNQEKWYIFYDNKNNRYILDYSAYLKTLGTVYMSKKTATRICEALNNGELTL